MGVAMMGAALGKLKTRDGPQLSDAEVKHLLGEELAILAA